MAQTIEVTLPDIGDFQDVEVIEILVQPGDRVEAEDPLITLESDKASMEIPSPQAGVIGEVKVSIGDKINQGDLIATLDAGGESAADAGGEDVTEAAELVEDAPVAVSESGRPPAAPGDSAPPAAAVDASAGEEREIRLPDIGDFRDVEIIELLVNVGDRIEAEQSLLTLESDKASMEIPAPFAGEVRSIAVALGDKINEGDLIATVATADAGDATQVAVSEPETAPAATPLPAEAAEPERPPGEKEQQRPPVMTRPADATRKTPHASPGVRRFARELGVDLGNVAGSGPKGRVTKEDVQAYVKRALAEGASAQTPAASGAGLVQHRRNHGQAEAVMFAGWRGQDEDRCAGDTGPRCRVRQHGREQAGGRGSAWSARSS